MLKNDLIQDLLKKLVSKKSKKVKLVHGSFITIGFGNDLVTEIILRKKKEIDIRPEWLLCVYMSDWELEQENELLTSSADERETIEVEIAKLENKKLIKFTTLDDNYSLSLEFEDNLTLVVTANNSDEDDEQWNLFTPTDMVLVAGPFQTLEYIDSNKA